MKKKCLDIGLKLESYNEGEKNIETAIIDDIFEEKLEFGKVYLKKIKTNNPRIILYDTSSLLIEKKEYLPDEDAGIELDSKGRYVMLVPEQYGFRLKKDKAEVFKYDELDMYASFF